MRSDTLRPRGAARAAEEQTRPATPGPPPGLQVDLTMLGLVPKATGLGEGGELQAPLARVCDRLVVGSR